MSVIRDIKIKDKNSSIYTTYDIGADAINVKYDNSKNVKQKIDDNFSDVETALDGKANVERKSEYGDTWNTKTWSGLTSFNGPYIWSDGDNIYYSNGSDQYVLDKSTSTWTSKTWSGLTTFNGNNIWTDGTNVYYSYGSNQYVLEDSFTWTTKTWSGLTSLYGNSIWTDGINVYYSSSSDQYVLDKATSTWIAKTWNGLTGFTRFYVWSDGTDIYYSYGSNHYVLDKSTSTWNTKTWSGLTSFYGEDIWTDGTNIYLSNSIDQYVLDKSTSTWNSKTWSGFSNFYGNRTWSDGDNIYCSSSTDQYVLDKTEETIIEDSITVKPNGDVATTGDITDGSGNILSGKVNKAGDTVSGVIAPDTDGTRDFGGPSNRFHYGYFRRLCAVESICNSTVANTNRINLPSATGTMALAEQTVPSATQTSKVLLSGDSRVPIDCNAVDYNTMAYYTSSGPSTSIGASSTDGALYTQMYNSSWGAQIAQDYRNGNLFVRGKNNGTWTAWKKASGVEYKLITFTTTGNLNSRDFIYGVPSGWTKENTMVHLLNMYISDFSLTYTSAADIGLCFFWHANDIGNGRISYQQSNSITLNRSCTIVLIHFS